MALADQSERLAYRLAAAAAVGLALGSVAAWAQDADTAGPPTAPTAKPTPQAGTGGLYSPGPGWQINLGATVSGTFTDNADQGGGAGFGAPTPQPTGGVSGRRRSEFITTFSPTLSISGDTPRVQANLYYSPSYSIYASDSRQNYFSQYLNGRAHAIVWEDRVYVDAYAYASQVPQYGGQVFGQTVVGPDGVPVPVNNAGVSRQNLAQVSTFSITPTAVQQFVGWGTATASATYGLSTSSAPRFQQTPNGFEQISAAGRSESLSESIQFVTGENLGRWQDSAYGTLTQFSGNGASQGGSTMTARNTLSYAVNRWLTVMGAIGYQSARYPGALTVTNNTTPTAQARPYKFDGIYWNGSAKVIPNSDSQITVGYGRSWGGEQFNADASYAVTARTTLTFRYDTSFGSSLYQLQQNIAGGGAPGVPPPPPINNGFLPGTQNIYRTNTLTASASTNWDVDAVSISFAASEQRVVATTIQQSGPAPVTPANGSSRSLSMTGSWSHQFSDVMNGAFYATLGRRTAIGVVSSGDNFLATSANLRYTFSPSLTGSAQYSFYDLMSQTPNRSYIQNVITVSLSKQF